VDKKLQCSEVLPPQERVKSLNAKVWECVTEWIWPLVWPILVFWGLYGLSLYLHI